MDDYRIHPTYLYTEVSMKKINILHLFTSQINKSRYIQILYRLLSNPNKEILHAVQVDSKEQDFHHSVVG